jgi:DNA-binding GntR family transcriptional regulator
MEPLLDHVRRVVTFVQSSTNANGHDRSRKRQPGAGQPGLRSQAETWDEHAEIVDAIADDRVGRARALAKSHVDRVRQVVVAFLVSAAPAKHGQSGFDRTPTRSSTAGHHASPLTVPHDSAK